MKIERYGIVLQRLRAEDAELVRNWRNHPKIAGVMFQPAEISAAMQREWFASVDNEQNFFFLIEHEKEPVGLINISSIDWEKRTAFSGLFIYEDNYIGTDVPVRASLCMLDVFLRLLKIEMVFAKVRGNNAAAHQYNTALGFRQTKKIELGLGFEYELQRENYLLQTLRLREAATRLYGGATRIELDETMPAEKWLKEELTIADAQEIGAMKVVLI